MPKNQEAPRARVFLSCGQSKDSDEVHIARTVAEKLRELDFEPWIAVEQQTLEGVKEYIFETLANSEYVIFVDFKREKLPRNWWTPWNHPFHRGSLFSHQELAVASHLGVDVLAFQESGTKLEGVLSFIGANAISFENRKTLPNEIANEVRKRLETGRWNSHWRNEIVLEREPTQRADVESDIPRRYRRFFHIIVRNRHRHRAATNCYVYLEKATNLDTSIDIPLRTFELKWEGFRLPYVNIPPESVSPVRWCLYPSRFPYPARLLPDVFRLDRDHPLHPRCGPLRAQLLGAIEQFSTGSGIVHSELGSHARRNYLRLAQEAHCRVNVALQKAKV